MTPFHAYLIGAVLIGIILGNYLSLWGESDLEEFEDITRIY